MGRAEGERHGRTQQYLQLVDHLSWRGERGTGASKARELERRTQQYLQLVDRLSGWGERGTGASKARELERMAGGWSEERGGGGKREKGLLYRGAPPRE